ncbi:MAG: class I SAM-dependent methyltransferase [Candidatus Nanohaloarchaea archaeon]
MTRERLYQKARYYDVLYHEKDYEGEVDFILEKYREKRDTDSEKVLVLGCGTGNHTKHLKERGFDVTALDRYQGMLDRAREKSDAEFRQTDLPEIEAEGSYGLVMMPFTVINHISEEEFRQTLENVKDLMEEGGVLIFDNGGFWLDQDESASRPFLETVETENGDVARLTQLHEKEEGLRFESVVFTPDGQFVDSHDLTTYTTDEVLSILEEKGFSHETSENGYRTGTSKDHGTVFIAY